MSTPDTFVLPSLPGGDERSVNAWMEPVTIPTYVPQAPDRNPMFLEKRVYQGSSGRVYPLPFIDRISPDAVDRTWQAVHLENEFIRVMVLPEIGGRIHIGLDKTNGYDFFYRQKVIKPALVGLAGPWISGGVEFNWPQHHRPATFMPVNVEIEEHEDGSRTVWCSDHDPMSRMKGMHGVCLHPGRALVEVKARLYNRTAFVQTFLWWANAAVRVHGEYQSFFPPDVRYVADHAKRAVSAFPICEGSYYGVDYAERRDEAMRARFTPPEGVSPADLSWYANIPVPTSYMALGTEEDFFGGYDHVAQAGLVHVVNHHIAPGKKQWTWGNHPFGYSWDRHLSDDGAPYIELMAGVYTDNQPDFSFLAPGETKTFSQFWYPIQRIGQAQKANVDAALSVRIDGRRARIGACVSRRVPNAEVEVRRGGEALARWERDLAPGAPLLEDVGIADAEGLTVVIRSPDGRELIRYSPEPPREVAAPKPATAAEPPEHIASNEELYLTGLHLEQYRHATRRPEDYWQEALRRDPGDSRCHNALGMQLLRRGEFEAAERHFRAAIETLTRRNPNPYDGEPFYNLGLALRFLGRDNEAYGAFFKATWNQAWQAAGFHAVAELDTKRGDWQAAIEHLDLSLRANQDHLRARNLKVIALRKLGRGAEAGALVEETLRLDPLDYWARHLASRALDCDNQVRLDIAFDCARAGLYEDAIHLLVGADTEATDGSAPTVRYALADLHARTGGSAEADLCGQAAAECPADYCFPSRLEEIGILEAAIGRNARDGRAPYLLGNLLYGLRRRREAIARWEQAVRLDSANSVAWRNLGIAYFNVLGDARKARRAFDRALQAAPGDTRVLYERDQLWKRTGVPPARRLAELRRRLDLVRLRDDLSVELAALYNQTGRHAEALRLVESREFQPWEGGEGRVLQHYVRACLALGRAALRDGDAVRARGFFERTIQPPENLGEKHHPLANRSQSYHWLATACAAAGDRKTAREWWARAASSGQDFQEMSVQAFSDMTYYRVLALRNLGKQSRAERLLRDLLDYARRLAKEKAAIDYFATSLPDMLLFEDDLDLRQGVVARFLEAQAQLGLGRTAHALRLLRRVLELDRNHPGAADLMAEIEAAGPSFGGQRRAM